MTFFFHLRSRPGIRIGRGDAARLPLPGGSVDGIPCNPPWGDLPAIAQLRKAG